MTAKNQPDSKDFAGVPILDLGRQSAELCEETLAALARVCKSGSFVLGPDVTELEKGIADYCRVEHAVGCASGSDALLLALMAFDIGPGDEVIVPSFTFFATASAVARLGAKPVFADIRADSFNLDPADVNRKLSPATRAILPVHLFGQCADMTSLETIANEWDLPIIEDAAQAIGAEFEGRRAGSMGQTGCFSFYPTKNLGGAGDGGMLTTRSADMAKRLRLLRGHGMQPRYYHKVVGINSRLDSFQAAVLNCKLPHLDQWTLQRQAIAEQYSEFFVSEGLDQKVVLPHAMRGNRHVWNQYVIRVPDGRRDALRGFLTDAKIGSEIYYPLGLHEQECFRHLGYAPTDLPQTYRASREVLALPIFPGLTTAEQELVVTRIGEFLNRASGHAIPAPKFLQHAAARRKQEARR
ncbi:MAG: DegT/DnrJ/EryC1/StrS family aminotransferase [Thermoguttaceae bacterium]|jgi:dTDP-4-amino-4,6-dideoxygalactose transaminase|nr:DegT/DnrJ/EryC1/StrS family aminotransferase [Thermoguttaceae bacterium]